MLNKISSWFMEEINCPVCGANQSKKLGIRGNKEYFGAIPTTEPHIVTNVVRCHRCDFIYTSPMVRGVEFSEKDYYNNSDEYQATQRPNAVTMFQKRLSFISKYKNRGRLLDVGSGKGEFLFAAQKKGWEVAGIEPSPNFCQFAKEHYGLNIYNGFLGENCEIRKSYFDIVTLNHVLEHIDNPGKLLKLAFEYLAADGLIFIEVPNADSYLLHIIDFYFKKKGLNWSSRLSPLHPPYHKYGFTRKSLLYLLKKCSYQRIKLKTFSGIDRGYQSKEHGSKIEALSRNFISIFTNFIGNRENLCVLVKPVR